MEVGLYWQIEQASSDLPDSGMDTTTTTTTTPAAAAAVATPRMPQQSDESILNGIDGATRLGEDQQWNPPSWYRPPSKLGTPSKLS